MKTAAEYQAQIAAAGNRCGLNVLGHMSVSLTAVPEAKQQVSRLTLLQKELRLIKKEIATVIKSLRAAYVAQKAQVQSSAALTSLLHIKGAGRMRSAQRSNLTRQQANAIAPYTAVSAKIDAILLALDDLKLQIQAWIIKQDAASK